MTDSDVHSAGDPGARKTKRPRIIIGALIAVLLVGITIFILIAEYWGYAPRGWVNEAIAESRQVRMKVTAFYGEHRRLPSVVEAKAFQSEQTDLKRALSIIYDPVGRVVVITMRDSPYSGKRIAIRADEKDGTLAWSCQAIDIDPRYLPASCR